MGLFDTIICNATLPGTPPEFIGPGHDFQTKSLECSMATYEITEDGRLVAVSGPFHHEGPIEPRAVEFHGVLDFYTSNLRGGYLGFLFTQSGEDAEFVDYRATFIRGELSDIEEARRTRDPALPVKLMDYRPASDCDEPELSASLLGRTMYSRKGWFEAARYEPVEIVAEGEFEWVGKDVGGHLEVYDRRFTLGNTLFKSPDQAREIRERADAAERDRREYFQRMLGERKA